MFETIRNRRSLRLQTITLLLAALIAGDATRAGDKKPVVLKPTRLTKSYFSKFFLRFTPDGSHLVYSRHHRNRRQSNLVLVGARIIKADGSGDRPLLTKFDSQVQIQEHPCLAPDGKTMIISGGGNDTGNSSKDTFICNIDGQFRASKLRKIVPGRSVQLGEEPVYSPDGKRIAFSTVDERLWIVDADGKNKAPVIQAGVQYCHQPAWSPDGRWIAFASDRDGSIELYKVRWDGSELTRLTKRDGIDCRPRWSRDGQWILFTSNRTGNYDLFLMRPDGTDVRPLTTHSAIDDHGAWSPDGKSIAFISMRDGGFDIYRMPVPADIKIGDAPLVVSPSEERPVGDLIAHWNFDRLSGEIIADETGRNPMQLHGVRVIISKGRGYLSFDGRDDFADCGNSAPLRHAGPLTISLWVRPEKLGGNGYLISKHGWNIYLGSDGLPRFETRDAANRTWNTLAASTPLQPAHWSHVAAVFDTKAQRMAVYVNGRLSSQTKRTDGAIAATASHPLELGRYNAGRSQHFHGNLDEIRIYNRALSDAEIGKAYRKQIRLVEIAE